MKRFRRFLGLLAPYKRIAAVSFVCILCANLLDLVFPWAMKLVIDVALAGRDPRLLRAVCVVLAGAFALRFVFGFLREYLFVLLGENVVSDLRNRLYWHLQRLSVCYREKTSSGELLSGLIGDVDSIRNFIFGGLIDFTLSLLTTVFVMVLLCCLSWKLAIVALAFLPFCAAVYLKHSPGLREGHGVVRKKTAELASRAVEAFNGARVVAGHAAEEYEAGLFARKLNEIKFAAIRSHRRGLLLLMGSDLISSIGLVAVVWMGGTMVIRGEMSAGTLVAFYSYLAMLLVPVVRMTVIGNFYQEASAAFDRISGTLALSPEVEEPREPVRVGGLKGEVEFRDIVFSYADGKPVLGGISLRVAAGSTLAICGKSGAGKTTLVSLLARFYDPLRGSILVDGTDIRSFRLKEYRSRLAMVLQDDYLFSGTVKENILYGREPAPMERVIAAAKAANCHDFILSLPGGYDAQVGEGGVKLSFGQRQRISIARAVLRDPAILILDEATSGVDSQTERMIVEDAYRHAMAGRTTLIIAHSIELVSRADRIIFLSDGRIAEAGTHRELMERRGQYWKMWEGRQAAVEAGP